MRLIFLPVGWTLALCFLVWTAIQVSAALLCFHLPNRFFNPENALFRSYHWERGGDIYKRLFRIRRWKHLLPDGASVWKRRGYKKKKLTNFTPENLNRYRIESARGELTHWLAIVPFWVFGFFVPPSVIGLMFLYAVIINVPCILAQRYNRPRMAKLLNNIDRLNRHKESGRIQK